MESKVRDDVELVGVFAVIAIIFAIAIWIRNSDDAGWVTRLWTIPHAIAAACLNVLIWREMRIRNAFKHRGRQVLLGVSLLLTLYTWYRVWHPAAHSFALLLIVVSWAAGLLLYVRLIMIPSHGSKKEAQTPSTTRS